MPDENSTKQPEAPVLNQPQAEVEFVVPDSDETLFTTYSNNVQVGWTHFDLRMVFGEIVEAGPQKVVVEQRAHITISYMQAKLLVLMLHQAITSHEALFGEIKLPTEATGFVQTNTQAVVQPGSSARR